MSGNDTARIGEVNTPGIAEPDTGEAMETAADRLRRARINAGHSNATAAARAFGWGEPGYRHHENGSRPFDLETARKYARAFRVSPGYLLGFEAMRAIPERKTRLEVIGAVAAGVWREQSEWPADERYEIEVGPPPYTGAVRFAVRLEGYSMDNIIPPGSELECLRIPNGPAAPQAGDLVIVERHAHGLTETTCKRLDIEDGEWILRAESTRPEFAEPIRIGRPDAAIHDDDEVRVIGIVLSAQQRHLTRRIG